MTNDKALRNACDGEGVATLWGLEIMAPLIRTGAMPAADAVRLAEKIHASNPLHVSKQILERFSRRIAAD